VIGNARRRAVRASSTTALPYRRGGMGRGCARGDTRSDARQGTLSRYVENREAYVKRKGLDLSIGACAVPASGDEADEKGASREELEPRWAGRDSPFIGPRRAAQGICRGSPIPMPTPLLTQLLTKLIDLDHLARGIRIPLKIVRPSIYAVGGVEDAQVRACRAAAPSTGW